jgi:Leucine-rich repeat (LRR) protein
LYKNLQETFNNAQGQKELVISNSTIHSLPLGYEKLNTLESLVFANCKNLNLEKVFEQLKALPNLKSLEISNSKIYQLPENIGNLSQLSYTQHKRK